MKSIGFYDWNRPGRRSARYERALRHKGGTHRADGDTVQQAMNYAAAAEHLHLLDVRVRMFLDGQPVSFVMRTAFLNFARAVDKVCRESDALTRLRRASMVVAHWQNYGLAREVLLTMCRELFSLDLDQAGPDGFPAE